MEREIENERRVRRRKDARPSELIEAALAEFTEKGFAATRVADIAERAGVSKGTAYRYFADKEALFIAAVASRTKVPLADAASLVDEHPGPMRDLLRDVISLAHAAVLRPERRALMRIVLTEGPAFPELTRRYYETTVRPGGQILDAIVRRGVESGEFADGAAARFPLVLLSPILLAAIWQMVFAEHEEIASEIFLEAHVDLILKALQVAPRT